MLVQRAAQFADNNQDSLRPFIRWLGQRGIRSLPESESATTEADDDAVRILTIHQAKGLEFPIVVVPKLQDQSYSATDVIIDRAGNRVEFQLGERQTPFRTSGYASARRRDQAYADAEARRMFYVAATRARDWLILPSFPADSLQRRDSFHTYLDDAQPDWRSPAAAGPNQIQLVVSPQTFDTPQSPMPMLREPPYEELRERWFQLHRAALRGGSRDVQALTPSQLAKSRELDFHADSEEEETSNLHTTDSDGEIDPFAFGTAVHESLEVADFRDLNRTRQRTIRTCHRLRIPPEPVVAHVARALASDLLQRAAQSDAVHRELPLTSIQESNGSTTIVEGIADLLFLDPAGWILVDYKSDRAIPAERREQYDQQLRQYASMLADAEMPVSEAYLLLTATGEAVRVSLELESAP